MKTYPDIVPTFGDRSTWTIPHVLHERAITHGDAVYLDAPEFAATYTYRETYELAKRTAANLVAHGVVAGDRVLVMAENSPEAIFTWFGCALAGVVHVPMNTAYKGTFLSRQVTAVEPILAVIDHAFASRFVDIRETCRSIKAFLIIGNEEEVRSAAGLLEPEGFMTSPATLLLEPRPWERRAARPSELGSIFFTSGTSGLSKGVMMPQGQLYFFADQCVSLTRLTDRDVYMSVGPLFHGNTSFLAALPALIAGARYVMYTRFSASRWAERVRQCGATVTNLIGVMMDFIWKQPARSTDNQNDLRCVFAVPTAYSISDGFLERFGLEAIVEAYGMTEISMPILSPYGAAKPASAAGLLVDEYFDVRLVDPETDEEVPVGEMGELVVRHRLPWTSLMGYYGVPDRTVEAFRNLWFHTGDGLRRDTDGWFYFVDRLKDAIRRRGENISSFEIEQAVLESPSVGECAVVGVPAGIDAGEDDVMLFVVPLADAAVTVEDLWAWCDERVPAFAVPRYICIVGELPKTPSEKVQKAELRALFGKVPAADRYAYAKASL